MTGIQFPDGKPLDSRRGFTLIELMVVISIIGLLASIAIPRYSTLKQRAYVASMKSDLHNLVSAEEAFYVGNDDYAGGVTSSGGDQPGKGGAGQVAFTFSPGVTLVRLKYRSNKRRGVGWNAVIKHSHVKDKTTDRCGVFMGATQYSPNKAVTSPGAIACW